MRAALALAGLLALGLAAQVALLVQQTVSTQPAAAVPVTLAAISGVNTTLGASLTTANVGSATPLVLPLLGSPADTLRIVRGNANWTVQLQVTGTSGLTGGDSVTLTLAGATTQSIAVTSGTSLPATSAAVTLASNGSNITVRAASGVPIVGGCGGLGTCTLTMQILLQPVAGTSPAVAYPFTLRAT